MSNRDGGPAYPKVISDPSVWHFDGGMTMRQRYKLAALQGLLASGPHDCEVSELVYDAALYANAMLAEDEAHEREAGHE